MRGAGPISRSIPAGTGHITPVGRFRRAPRSRAGHRSGRYRTLSDRPVRTRPAFRESTHAEPVSDRTGRAARRSRRRIVSPRTGGRRMILLVAQVAGGLVLLYYGGEWLVRGAVSLAERSGASPLVIGLSVVAAGTSAPELFVSLVSVLENKPAIAIGNVVGSNIANILLVLGMAALIWPVVARKSVIRWTARFSSRPQSCSVLWRASAKSAGYSAFSWCSGWSPTSPGPTASTGRTCRRAGNRRGSRRTQRRIRTLANRRISDRRICRRHRRS